MDFAKELEDVLPADLPNRANLVQKAAGHLEMISKANEHFNLTRITSPREAAIKHVYDSIAPWRFFANAKRVLDVGTGAGFPGIPLSLALPEIDFTLAESIQKKARFVDEAVNQLALHNVHVTAERAESVAATLKPDIITARAVAPLDRFLSLFGKTLKHGAQLLLYKGPDIATELAAAGNPHARIEELWRYELPDELGTRVLLSVRAR